MSDKAGTLGTSVRAVTVRESSSNRIVIETGGPLNHSANWDEFDFDRTTFTVVATFAYMPPAWVGNPPSSPEAATKIRPGRFPKISSTFRLLIDVPSTGPQSWMPELINPTTGLPNVAIFWSSQSSACDVQPWKNFSAGWLPCAGAPSDSNLTIIRSA